MHMHIHINNNTYTDTHTFIHTLTHTHSHTHSHTHQHKNTYQHNNTHTSTHSHTEYDMKTSMPGDGSRTGKSRVTAALGGWGVRGPAPTTNGASTLPLWVVLRPRGLLPGASLLSAPGLRGCRR